MEKNLNAPSVIYILFQSSKSAVSLSCARRVQQQQQQRTRFGVRCFKAALYPSPMRSNRHYKRVNTPTQFDVLVHYQVKYDYGMRAIGNVTGLAPVCIEPKNYALSKFNENQFHLCACRRAMTATVAFLINLE